MTRKRKTFGLDEPLRHPAHERPLSRRQFISQGLARGGAAVMGASLFSLFADPRSARAELSADLNALLGDCGIAQAGAGKIPFICFDLAGGANIAGSNVMVGRQGGQHDYLPTAGYSKLGLPGDMVPDAAGAGSFIDTSLGLAFHSDSAFLRGMKTRLSAGTMAAINGAVIPARSENDTGLNPHNPMYAVWRAGADGELLTLIGSRNSESGGNSMAPPAFVEPSVRPTKVDRPGDVTGLVDTGKLVGLLSQEDAVAVMESIARISKSKLDRVNTRISRDAVIKEMVRCGYIKSASIADRYGNPSALNPELDAHIKGASGIFSDAEFAGDAEYRKTAAVMKMVVNGYAGAGTITMGGFDYHTSERATGELRDFRAGACMGACLEYAARIGVPLMLYVFSDGSVNSNGMLDSSPNGRGKGVWTGDDQSTAASFFLVYNPAGRPALYSGDGRSPERHQQLGWFRADGSVDTVGSPAGNNVNLLVEMVALNYMALHGEQGQFAARFPLHGMGSPELRDSLIAFNPVVNGHI